MAYRLKSPEEIRCLARTGEALWRALCQARAEAVPGVSSRRLEAVVLDRCEAWGLSPSLPAVRHPETGEPFPGVCSISVNDEAAHAPPGDRILAPNDLVTIDLAASLDGWHADAAVTVLVTDGTTEPSPERARLADAAVEVTQAAIEAMRPGRRWSEAAAAARQAADDLGVFILPGLGGHGIGRALHEPPAARFDTTHDSPHDFGLAPGAVLTVEPVVTLGPDTLAAEHRDGWTLRTASGGPAACEERTVAMTPSGPRVLTGLGRA